MPDDADNARLGSQRFSPWPGARLALFPEPSARLLGTADQRFDRILELDKLKPLRKKKAARALEELCLLMSATMADFFEILRHSIE
jgi:hypothetical protein